MSDTATETGISSIVLLRSRIALVACMLLLFWASLFALPAIAAFAPKTPSKPANDECLACHNDSALSKDEGGKPVSLYVNDQHYKASIHSIFSCVDCHTDVKTSPHEATPAKITCAQCHAEQQAAYDKSYHAQARNKGAGQAATCVDCHGSPHELLPASDSKSRVNHANVAATCGACHGQKFVMEAVGESTQPFNSYQQSVHGRAVAAGSEKAAVCTDCHGTHDLLAGPVVAFDRTRRDSPGQC